MILERIHNIDTIDVMPDEISNEYHAKITGFPFITTKNHANTELMITTLRIVSIRVGMPCPRPCITLLHVIPMVINGYANTNTLKYSIAWVIILLSFVNPEIISRLKIEKNILKNIEIIIEQLSPYLTISLTRSIRFAPENIPTNVTNAVAIEIIGRKNRCSTRPAVWYAATASFETKITL